MPVAPLAIDHCVVGQGASFAGGLDRHMSGLALRAAVCPPVPSCAGRHVRAAERRGRWGQGGPLRGRLLVHLDEQTEGSILQEAGSFAAAAREDAVARLGTERCESGREVGH